MIKRLTLALGLILTSPEIASAKEVCAWASNKGMELRNLMQNGIPKFALVRFSQAMVREERDESFMRKIEIEAILQVYIDLYFDPEFSFMVDGRLSDRDVKEVLLETCEETL